MQGYNRQYSGSGRQTFGGGGGYGGGYDSRGTLMSGAGGPMRGPGGGYPDQSWGSGMGSSYGSSNYNRSMGAGYGSNRQQGQSADLRDSLNHMRDMGGRENTLALGILDAVKSLGVLGSSYGPSGSRQGLPNAQSNRTLVQLTHPGGQLPPGSNQPSFNRGQQQNWNRNTKVNMVKRLGNNQFNKAKVQQTKKPLNKITLIKTTANKVDKKVSPKKEGETEDKDNSETDSTTGENGTTDGTESSEKLSDKKNDDTPKEALKCHMCNVEKFASVTAYLNHLESQNHQQMSELFHAKGRVTLQLLQANAALATQRIMNNSRKVGVKGRILECFKCQCRIPSTLAKHMKSPEHQLVVNYMAEKCCGRSYNNREDLEEHRLSLVHLRRQMACEARKDEKADKDQEQIDALGMEGLTTEEQQAALNNKVEEDVKAVHLDIGPHYTLETIPPYDPDTALGKNLVLTKTQYQCRCCRQLFPSGLNAIESHCRSSNHYEHFLTHVKQQAEQKQQGKLEKKDGANSDSDDSKAESDVKKEKTPETDNKEENNKEEEEEPELDEDLDAMETIDFPLDGTNFDDEEVVEEIEEVGEEIEEVGEEIEEVGEEIDDLGEEEKKVENELCGNGEELEEGNGPADKKGVEESTEDKTATSEEQDTVNEETEVVDDNKDDDADDDDMGVNSPASHYEDDDDDDDDDDEDEDEEDFNPKRRARGSTKSTPAKRALTDAPARRGRHPSSL